MRLRCGFDTGGSDGEAFEGLPGLLVTIAFVFMLACVFLPRDVGEWYLVLFLAVEVGAAILYVLADRHGRRESDRLRRELHKINC